MTNEEAIAKIADEILPEDPADCGYSHGFNRAKELMKRELPKRVMPRIGYGEAVWAILIQIDVCRHGNCSDDAVARNILAALGFEQEAGE